MNVSVKQQFVCECNCIWYKLDSKFNIQKLLYNAHM